jgi:hypothetical protein
MITILPAVAGSLSTVAMAAIDRMTLIARGLSARNHSTLELLLVALSIVVVYATAQRWSLRDHRNNRATISKLSESMTRSNKQDDGRHAA